MQIVPVDTWQEFDGQVKFLRDGLTQRTTPILFRGHSDENWLLESTLDRTELANCSLEDYFLLISRVKPQIQAFTNKEWQIPDRGEFIGWLTSSDTFMPWRFPAYEYMVYLRHHGFPSPLLDWTASPYVAAYFAFSRAKVNETVAIYAYVERPLGTKGTIAGQPEIYSLGQYVHSHKRHFLQQCHYTICIKRDETEWRYAAHEDVIAQNAQGQDELWKFVLPASERINVLSILDEYNLNGYSLFGSEESLMETMAFRELEKRFLRKPPSAAPMPNDRASKKRTRRQQP